MAHNERADEIARLIQSVRKISVAELSRRFQTSQVTIRKDLEALERNGLVLRTHGGAILAEDRQRTIPFSRKIVQNVEAKERIAERALDLLGDARTVLLDAGSTTLAIARRLRALPVFVITNSLTAACELASRPSGSFVLLGGDWRQESSAFVGPYALRVLDEINADVAFVGASGFDVESGFTCQNSIESQLKARMLSRAVHAYIVADSSKWDVTAFSTFAHLKDVEALVTDDGLPRDARQRLEAAGAFVLTPSGGARRRLKQKHKEIKRKG